MERSEALQYFRRTWVERKSFEKLMALETYFQENKEILAIDFIDSIRNLSIRIKEMQSKKLKGKIGFISCSMLRTALLDGKYACLLEAFDKEWFLDFVECHGQYDAGWAFKYLEQLGNELEEKRKSYIGNISVSDIEKFKMEESGKFNEYVISLARYAMPKASLLKEFKEIEKFEELEVRVGEYRDATEVVYKEDTRVKDSKEIKDWFEEKLDEDGYAYEIYINLDLSGGDYEDIDLSYADFSRSNLSYSNLKECILIGTKFMDCTMVNVDLSGSIIYDCDFRGCNLKGSKFNRVDGAKGIIVESAWEMPGYSGVSFEGADLEGVQFVNADLKGAIFIGANLKNVNLKGTKLEGAVFLEKDKVLLDLNERQIKSIEWKS